MFKYQKFIDLGLAFPIFASIQINDYDFLKANKFHKLSLSTLYYIRLTWNISFNLFLIHKLQKYSSFVVSMS